MKPKPDLDLRERFLAKLFAALARPSADRPTTRCLSGAQLRNIFGSVRDELRADGVSGVGSLSNSGLLTYLVNLGLAQAVPVVAPPGTRRGRRPEFCILGIEKPAAGSQVEPVELLQAHEPGGFICYFTALAFHGLTTQPPTFHHIGLPVAHGRRDPADADDGERPPASPKGNGPPRRRNPLGVLAFTYQGTEYFVTRRASRLAPGIQTRYIDQRTLIRITTIEQTLLDTLHKPQRAGGPEVIFEAWRARASELDEELLASYLRAMNDAPSVRRTGAMLDLLGHKVSSDALNSVLGANSSPSTTRSPFSQASTTSGWTQSGRCSPRDRRSRP